MKKTLLALALIGTSSAVLADSWIYGGVSVGQSDLDGINDTSYGIHAGTGILPFIGVEMGYTKHGDFDLKSETLSAESLYLALKPSIDFGPLHVYAKGGIHKWDVKSNRFNDDGYDLMYGVGAEYFVFGPISVGASFMHSVLDKNEVDTLSFNATFHFL